MITGHVKDWHAIHIFWRQPLVSFSAGGARFHIINFISILIFIAHVCATSHRDKLCDVNYAAMVLQRRVEW